VVTVQMGSPVDREIDATSAAFDIDRLNLWYGSFQAIKDVTLRIPSREITALIGPSGCGKSTLLRCLNRMNDLVPSVRVEGRVTFEGINIYDPSTDPVEVRRRIGMVFQKPNPFPKPIFDNVAFGPRVNGFKGNLSELVEFGLTKHLFTNPQEKRTEDYITGRFG